MNMKTVKQPKVEDFIIQSEPLTDDERKLMSEHIRLCKLESIKSQVSNPPKQEKKKLVH